MTGNTYLPLYVHTSLPALHDVGHLAECCPSQCNAPLDLRREIPSLCHRLTISRTFEIFFDPLKNPWGGVGQLFLAENESHIYPKVCQIWLLCDSRLGKRVGGADRQTDKGTLQLYIVDCVLQTYSKEFR